MLRLITGLPGAGKTQLTIAEALKEKRAVYFCNMKLTTAPAGWSELNDFRKWSELPSGSLLLVDEAQDYMLATASTADPHIRDLAVHRHKGLDIWLITQDPKQIHAYVRRLIGEWFHLIRVFGQNAATVEVRDSTDERRPVIETRLFRYDKKIWTLYNSATVHTKHGRIPFKLVAGVVLVVLGFIFIAWRWNSTGVGVIDGTASKKAMSTLAPLAAGVSAPVAPVSGSAPSPVDPLADACPVLTGLVQGPDRAIMIFETPEGATFSHALHPKSVTVDEITVKGCAYYLAGGSLHTRDSASRKAVHQRKEQERQREAAIYAAPVAAPAAITPGQVARSAATAPDVKPSYDPALVATLPATRATLRAIAGASP